MSCVVVQVGCARVWGCWRVAEGGEWGGERGEASAQYALSWCEPGVDEDVRYAPPGSNGSLLLLHSAFALEGFASLSVSRNR